MSEKNDFVIENGVLKAYVGSDVNVIIPDGVTEIDAFSFSPCQSFINNQNDRKNIKSVFIPNGVISIGYAAFEFCENLEEITIPKSITTIGGKAFNETAWLKNKKGNVIVNGIFVSYIGSEEIVLIPDGVVNIASSAFEKATYLKEVRIPNSVVSIGSHAFAFCEQLTQIIIPDGVSVVENGTFYFCKKLKKISFGQNIRVICDYAFYGCGQLSRIPDMTQVEIQGDKVFFRCNKLADSHGCVIVGNSLVYCRKNCRSLVVSDSVTDVNPFALEDCEKLSEIIASPSIFKIIWSYIKSSNKWEVSLNCLRNGYLYDVAIAYIKRNKEKIFSEIVRCDDIDMLHNFLSLMNKPNLDTVDSFIEIAKNNINILSVLLDYKAKNFSHEQVYVFEEKKLNQPFSLGERTLKEWREIYKFSVKDGGVRISGYRQSDSVVEIPSSICGYPITAIGDGAFKANTFIEQVALPDGITSIGYNAFKGCINLKHIRIPDSVEEIDFSAFEKCSSLQTIVLPQNMKRIACDAFKGCTNLKSVILPEKIDTIPMGQFHSCVSLEQVIFPDGLTKIYDYAFRDCKIGPILYLPKNLEYIGYGAFSNCKAIVEIILPGSIKTIDQYAFHDCTNLTKVRIPSSVQFISPKAFGCCKKLAIHTSAGSYAETYAKENNIPCVVE